MAIWQFYCNIVSVTRSIDKLSHDEMISWWDIPQPRLDIDFLQREESWTKNIIQYGDIDGTCILFIYHENNLDEIQCRMDLRTISKSMFDNIIAYVQSIKACFLIEDKIYPPETESIVKVMMQSKAYQYCQNPLEYFKSFEEAEGEE